MEVTGSYKSDALQLGSLLDSLGIDDLEAVAADSAYLSRVNCDRIEALGVSLLSSSSATRGERAWGLLLGGGWFMRTVGILSGGWVFIILGVWLSRRFLR